MHAAAAALGAHTKTSSMGGATGLTSERAAGPSNLASAGNAAERPPQSRQQSLVRRQQRVGTVPGSLSDLLEQFKA